MIWIWLVPWIGETLVESLTEGYNIPQEQQWSFLNDIHQIHGISYNRSCVHFELTVIQNIKAGAWTGMSATKNISSLEPLVSQEDLKTVYLRWPLMVQGSFKSKSYCIYLYIATWECKVLVKTGSIAFYKTTRQSLLYCVKQWRLIYISQRQKTLINQVSALKIKKIGKPSL